MDRFIEVENKLINICTIGSIEKDEQHWCVNLDAIKKRYAVIIKDKTGNEMHVEIYMTKEERDIVYEDLKRKVMGM